MSLVTPVSVYRQHSSNDNNPYMREDVYRHAVWISGVDARARGIQGRLICAASAYSRRDDADRLRHQPLHARHRRGAPWRLVPDGRGGLRDERVRPGHAWHAQHPAGRRPLASHPRRADHRRTGAGGEGGRRRCRGLRRRGRARRRPRRHGGRGLSRSLGQEGRCPGCGGRGHGGRRDDAPIPACAVENA